MKPHRPVYTITLALALALPFPLLASAAKSETIEIGRLSPAQRAVGKAASARKVVAWQKRAKDAGLSFEDYARDELAPRVSKKLVTTFVSPDGATHPTDMHHRIYAMLKVEAETGAQFNVQHRVVRDYTGWSLRDYAKDVVKRGLVWIGGARKPAQTIKLVEALPKTFADLKDDPLRGAMEDVFFRLGLSGGAYQRFVEFKLADRLIDAGLFKRLRKAGLLDRGEKRISAELGVDPRLADEIVRLMRSKKMKKYLAGQATTPAARKAVLVALAEPS